jgi:glucose/arabinose dehydrogenase
VIAVCPLEFPGKDVGCRAVGIFSAVSRVRLAAGVSHKSALCFATAAGDARPDLTKPLIYWTPIIAPGNLMFYHGTKTFPQWNGNGLMGGMQTQTLNRIIFDGHGGAKTAERWSVWKRIRDVEEGPDGSRWMLEDANPGAVIHVTPK